MPVRPPSLRAVAAFEAAARHASFTRAADELNLTPGAISHAIKALETRLGQRLFRREGRSVNLTAEGRTLAARVRLSLGLLADAFDTSPWRSRDRLVVSTLASVATRVLLPHLDELKSALPGVTLDFRCGNALADFDRVDVAVRFGPGGWSGVQSRFLGPEHLVPVASPAYLEATARPAGQADLRTHTLIHHPESSWRLWLDPAEPDPTEAAAALHLDDTGLVIEAAKAAAGIALVRERIARAEIASGKLVPLFDRAVPAEYSYWAVWRGSSPKTDLIAAFIDAISPLFVEKSSSVP